MGFTFRESGAWECRYVAAAQQVVVAAAILRGDPPTHVLAVERATPAALAGQWEFPGGKVEPGETEPVALARECQEELGVSVAVGRRVGRDVATADGRHVLRVWTARVTRGEVQLREHSAARWLDAATIRTVPWLAVDLPVVAAVRRLLRGLPHCPT